MWRRNASVLLIAVAGAALSALALAPSVDASGGHRVRMLDTCDPASFNAAIGPDTCVSRHHGHGHDTTFDEFIGEACSATQTAADWKFKPSMLTVRAGWPVILENRGETNTFTLVKQLRRWVRAY